MEICPDCKGTGTVERRLVKTIVGKPETVMAEQVIEPAVYSPDGLLLKEAVIESLPEVRIVEVEADAWQDQGSCPRCAGCGGVESI